MAQAAAEVLGIPLQNIITKMRRHQKGKTQYEKIEDSPIMYGNDTQIITGLVQEQGQIFKINLGTYLDNGLFFDHRPLRSIVRDTCSNKDVLNLFCYTGSFSVYAAQGNAKSVESVDLSNTYLTWAKENLIQNGFSDKKKYLFTRQDCIQFLQEKALAQKAILNEEKNSVSNQRMTASQNKDLISKAKTYDLIILDPPTFSNGRSTTNILDINKQWYQLVKDCLNILNPNGILYFSTNSERLKFDITKLPQITISGKKISCNDITSQTIPNDYTGSKPHRCWKFTVTD